jgi:hypothetical protein
LVEYRGFSYPKVEIMSPANTTTETGSATAYEEASPESFKTEAKRAHDAILEQGENGSSKPCRGLQFWMIIVGLSVAGVLLGLESTVITTSLPTITAELNIGEKYIWDANVFFLTM